MLRRGVPSLFRTLHSQSTRRPVGALLADIGGDTQKLDDEEDGSKKTTPAKLRAGHGTPRGRGRSFNPLNRKGPVTHGGPPDEARRVLFRRPLPSEERMAKLQRALQDSPDWQEHKRIDPNVGASAKCEQHGTSSYVRPLDLARRLQGRFGYHSSESIFTKIGHTCEDLIMKLLKHGLCKVRGVADVRSEEIGVLFNRRKGKEWSTASCDFLLHGGELVLPESYVRVSLENCVMEAKCPSRKWYLGPCDDHLLQVTTQMDTLRSQPDPALSRRTCALLTVLQIPFDKDRLQGEDGRNMRFTILEGEPWVLNCWLVPLDDDFVAWMDARERLFAECYERYFDDLGLDTETLQEKMGLHFSDQQSRASDAKRFAFMFDNKQSIPDHVRPKHYIVLDAIKFAYRGRHEVALPSKDGSGADPAHTPEDFLNEARFALIGKDGTVGEWFA